MDRFGVHLGEVLSDPSTFIRRIFSNELRTATRKATERVNMPPEAKAFLCSVGLPIQNAILMDRWNDFSFNLVSSLPCLGELTQSKVLNVPTRYNHCLCIALNTKYQYAVCVDPSRNSCILSLSFGEACKETFVNSGVEKLGAFLAIYVGYCNSAFPLPPENEGKELHTFMMQIDAVALEHPNWWSGIMEEILADIY